MSKLGRKMKSVGPLLLLGCMGATAACTGTPDDGVAEATDDVTSTSGFTWEGSTTLRVTSAGGGTAAPGSECRPEEEGHTLLLDARRLISTWCRADKGEAHTRRTSDRTLTESELDAVLRVAKSVSKVESGSCGPRTPLMKMTVDGPQEQTFADHSGACAEPNGPFARGIGAVLEALREVAAPVPAEPAVGSVATSAVLDDAVAITAESQGSGEMPAGSTCVPGYERYSYFRDTRFLAWSTCDKTDAGRHFGSTQYRALSDADIETIFASARGLAAKRGDACVEGKPFQTLEVFRLTTGGSGIETLYDAAYACRRPDLVHVNGMDPVFAAFRALAKVP